MKPFTYADLSAGIGGFRVALDAIGGRCVLAVEPDPKKRALYLENFGNGIPFHEEIPADAGGPPVDVVAFCLQGRSFKDRSRSADGDLVAAIAFVKAVRPRTFLIDAAPTAFRSRANEIVALDFLQDAGYAVSRKTVDARAWVPQARVREIIVASAPGRPVEIAVPSRRPAFAVKDILEDVPDDAAERMSGQRWASRRNRAAKEKDLGWTSQIQVVRPDDVAPNIVASHGGSLESFVLDRPDTEPPRRFTAREFARLGGFPDWHVVPAASSLAQEHTARSPVPPMISHVIAFALKGASR